MSKDRVCRLVIASGEDEAHFLQSAAMSPVTSPSLVVPIQDSIENLENAQP